jgi:Ca-activated chloride channel homolog
MTMTSDGELERLGRLPVPPADSAARRRALDAAMAAFDENFAADAQGRDRVARPSTGTTPFWRRLMDRKLIAVPALAGVLVLPFAGYVTLTMMTEMQPPRPNVVRPQHVSPTAPAADAEQAPQRARPLEAEAKREDAAPAQPQVSAANDMAASQQAMPAPAPASAAGQNQQFAEGMAMRATKELARVPTVASPSFQPQQPAGDRFESFDTNPLRSALEHPVSTFSIDADTASYSFVRRALKEGVLPSRDTVRVEEMVNYFPYDWKGPESADTPFEANVALMPTPWNQGTKLMHVAIKGYELAQAQRPQANLVFLVDVSGSMNEPDKLQLLKSAFRLLVTTLGDQDTVAIVAYAGNAGTVLEPTRGSEREKILAAIDRLEAGGSTAGEAGIREAYRLAQSSFVEGGVNRVMLATDGDFNVGQTSDEDLKRLIEERRASGVFLSVFGFGRGNLNDRMMQTIAQNGNGTAAYIDTLAEAQKVLVEEASSTLFPIAKDVKIQVEFNPARIAEYQLIGYETRALAREDFNNDRVDAGEIGSGHSVTAIYEVTPVASSARLIDDLRYGGDARTGEPTADDEYAFVKIRYKLPSEETSQLITRAVTDADATASFDAASTDQRFSVAVAAFGQKLRGSSQTSAMSFQEIEAIGSAARGADPFGYRAEFLSLVRLASALEPGRR